MIIESRFPPLYKVIAELRLGDVVMAGAEGKFMRRNRAYEDRGCANNRID